MQPSTGCQPAVVSFISFPPFSDVPGKNPFALSFRADGREISPARKPPGRVRAGQGERNETKLEIVFPTGRNQISQSICLTVCILGFSLLAIAVFFLLSLTPDTSLSGLGWDRLAVSSYPPLTSAATYTLTSYWEGVGLEFCLGPWASAAKTC